MVSINRNIVQRLTVSHLAALRGIVAFNFADVTETGNSFVTVAISGNYYKLFNERHQNVKFIFKVDCANRMSVQFVVLQYMSTSDMAEQLLLLLSSGRNEISMQSRA